MIRIFLALIVVVIGMVAVVGWWGHQWLEQPIVQITQPVTFEVPRGASLRAVASDLHQRGWLEQPQLWTLWARVNGRSAALKAGEYQLMPGVTPNSLLQQLGSGVVLLHAITFIEGSTFADIRVLLSRNDAVRLTLQNAGPEEVMRELGDPGVHPEGQFFPDTYHFPRGTTDREILAIAHRRMQDELRTVWAARAADLPLASSYEALILASIVEKETALVSERPLIAGVFVERLRRGMRLQTDPTVIYGIGTAYDGNIRRSDLITDTPYNTYTRAGLPPTPIALPGLDSLRAAVNPQSSGAIFFVATGNGDGSHHFSATLSEHEAAVQRYLRKLRQR
jgi:UPF0755 protein